MNKTPIAVALERQIPEYIRGEYELFVKFIKAYYEFLDQTQQRDLEDIRSINKTLDEFVIRFKKELSVLFPTNGLTNERFILERIREFYKARGSKESYQFLFRALFNKEADVFYPSTQILRASDGKWIQEKSIFVAVTNGDLFNFTGKIIEIKTTQKTIQLFSPRVVYYRDNIYEVFIERAYTQDIFIGNTVSSIDGATTGTILPCPAKYTITSEGSGFEVGKLYNLKTESGDGSLIKITKIGSGGAIKKIQIISFGLDYESTFYAKLSNKIATAAIYHHPVPGPYPDGNDGFVDYGYINKQDYFYYDEFYTPAVNSAETVFYVDGSYVGEIIGSFYTNASNTNVIDITAAEIKIELGAVAVYPGYYEASDGFISDACFIQDGKYYQLFSYVIKVEEHIDAYYDIVKQLLHPAGLELYAQYNIKNQYLVSATPLLAFIRRQFLDQEYITDDEGTNAVYKTSDDSQLAVHTSLQDIKDVVQAKADSITTLDDKYYNDSKFIDVLDAIVSLTDERTNYVQLVKDDGIDQVETLTDDFTQAPTNDNITPVQSSTLFQFSGASWSDTSIIADQFLPLRFPAYDDSITLSGYFSGGIQYYDADVFAQAVSYSRNTDDILSIIQSSLSWDIQGATFNQIASAIDGTPSRTWDRTLTAETINNSNTGSLYYNAYNQNDALDATTSYSYEAQVYSVHDTRALS